MPKVAYPFGGDLDLDESLPGEDIATASSPNWAPVLVAACLIVTLQINLVFAKSINWDEFFYFSEIQQLNDGLLTQSLQTFHTRLFGVLRQLPLDPVGQLLTGRVFMLACELVAGYALYGIARRFVENRVAALCALTYLSAGYVFLHGFAFRADPLATALLMMALLCLLRRDFNWQTVTIISVILGLASAITIKVVFYAPAFAGVAWLRWDEAERDNRRAISLASAAMIVGSAAVFAGLVLAHRTGIDTSSQRNGTAASALDTVFAAGLVPQANYLWQQILLAPHAAMLILAAPLFWGRFKNSERVALVGFVLPLMTIAFYRNSYPYYFVFVLAPAMVTVGPALNRLLGYIGYWPYIAILSANALVLNLVEPRQVLANQRSLVAGVHQIFPRPVAHFGFSGMIGDFPRPLSILVSGWGLQSYRSGEQPTLIELANERPIPLLIVNHPVIVAAVENRPSAESLLPADAKMLRENYLQHWGIVWVAGKRIPKGTGTTATEFIVPGTYTVEGGNIRIDSNALSAGEVVYISRGKHVFTADPFNDADVRWGNHLTVPSRAPPSGNALFTDY